MINASQIRPGVAIRYEYQTYKVIAADYHPGQGRTGGVNYLRLKDLVRGTFWEHSSALTGCQHVFPDFVAVKIAETAPCQVERLENRSARQRCRDCGATFS